MTSVDLELQKELYEYADNPQYECDRVIQENIRSIPMLNTLQMQQILGVRRVTERLCRKFPYSREDILSLINNNEVSTTGIAAQIEDNLVIIEYIFGRATGGGL